jgi:hypothetical protein
MINQRHKNSVEVSKRSYFRSKELYCLGLSFLGLAGVSKIPNFRIAGVKVKSILRVSLTSRCVLSNQRLNNSRSYKMTRMVYKSMLNRSKINGVKQYNSLDLK